MICGRNPILQSHDLEVREPYRDRSVNRFGCHDSPVGDWRSSGKKTACHKLNIAVLEMLNERTYGDISVRLSSVTCGYINKYPHVISFLTAHTINHDIYKANIMAEDFNRHLQSGLKTIEAFKTVATAFTYLNMFRNYIRFKPCILCKGARKYPKRKSPVELCNYRLHSCYWTKNSIKLPKLSTQD